MCVIERWRDVVGYEGMYQVSDLGQVRSVDRVVIGGHDEPKKLKGRVRRLRRVSQYNHLGVTLYKEGVAWCALVHRLVAAAWIGPCPNGCECRHGPAGVADNSVGNLSYGTPSQNGQDRRRDGTHCGKAVVRSDNVEFINMQVAAEESGCARTTICACCNGRAKTAGGYGWRYA
jgi:hypothetical protein